MAHRIDDGDREPDDAPAPTRGRLTRLASIATAPSTLVAAVAVAALASAIAIVPASPPPPRPAATPSAASGTYEDGLSSHDGSQRTAGAPAAPAAAEHRSAPATPTTTTDPAASGHASTVTAAVTSGTAAAAPGVSLTLPDTKALGLPPIPPITLPIHLPLPGTAGQVIPDVLGAATAPLTSNGGPTTTVPLVSGLLNQLTKNVKR